MGKYIIDIDEQFISTNDEIKVERGLFVTHVPVEPYTECSGKELLRAIRGLYSMPCADMAERFNNKTRLADVIKEFSAEEIVSKYSTWEGKPEVGDEVIFDLNGTDKKAVLLRVNSDDRGYYIDGKGEIYLVTLDDYVKKTGRHFDSVKKLLREIGE